MATGQPQVFDSAAQEEAKIAIAVRPGFDQSDIPLGSRMPTVASALLHVGFPVRSSACLPVRSSVN